MKYFYFFIVATVFVAVGWFLRGELKRSAEPTESLEVSFPLNVEQETMEYLEGDWYYEDTPTTKILLR